jgi:peptidyl-dipeptidase A
VDVSWHDNVGAPMRGDYQRMVGIANEGAVGLGLQGYGRDVALGL